MNVHLPTAAEAALADHLLDDLRTWAGLDLGPGQQMLALGLIQEQMRASGVTKLDEFADALARDTAARRRLAAGLSNKETSFFRCPQQFDALRDQVLPELLATRAATRRLHLWSAGCSTGAEPYSLAMVLVDLLGPALRDWEVHIWATDLDPQAIAVAQAGRYPRDKLRGLPAALAARHLVRVGHEYLVAEPVRALVSFAPLNLVDPAEWSRARPADLILCRNVLIYFDRQTTREVVARFGRVLADDGYLMVGHAETLWGLGDLLQPVRVGDAFVHRRATGEKSVPTPASQPEPASCLFEQQGATAGDGSTCAPQTPSTVRHVEEIETAEVLCVMAHALANHGQLAEAAMACERAIARDPLSADAYRLGGLIALSQEDLAAAEAAFQRLAYLCPQDPIALYYLAVTFQRQKRSARAAAGYRSALRLLAKLPAETPLAETSAGLLRLACERALYHNSPGL